MSGVPVVASLLVTRRRPLDAARTLERIAGQTLPSSIVLVVNVEADRETAAITRAHAANRPETEYLPIVENVGPAGAIAVGLPAILQRCPDADYVAFFEDDDPPPSSDSLARLVGHLRTRPGGERVGGAGFHGAVLSRRSAALRRPNPQPDGWADVDYIAGGSCPVFTRALLEEVGGYDPSLFFGFEELEFGLRAKASGWRLHVVPHDSFVSRIPIAKRSIQLEDWSWRRYYSLRNLLVILLRHERFTTAVRVALVRGMAKPLLWLPRCPALAVRHLRYNVLAVHDAFRGQLGRRLEPD